MAKVLVVDDEALVCEFLRRSLEEDGHEVIEVYGGSEAVEKYRKEWPDLVFLDVSMRGMGGIETLRRIREIDSDAMVVMVTAMDDIYVEREAREAGALEFLRKGIGFETFITVARRLLTLRKRGGANDEELLGRILVADDEPSVREVLKDFLEEKGYKVETAADGHEALAKVKHYRPHVLIADVRMPGRDGLAVLEELRQSDPSIGVILITAYPEAVRDYPVLQMGAHDLIVKPFSLEQLEASVLTRIAKMIT